MSDYLHDGEGTPDPAVERLESSLAAYRWRGRPSPWPLVVGGAAVMAAAAVLTFVVGQAMLDAPSTGPWSAATASCDGCTWEIGQDLDTSELALARIADRGLLRAQPGARLVRLPSDDGARFRLDEGTISVEVVAPPEWLVIETPGVRVVDLGCAYTLTVDEHGNGGIVVKSGAVALVGETRTEVLAGAAAATWESGYTGLPVRVDAPDDLVAAVDAWDRGQTREVAPLCQAARPEDAATLFALLERVDDPAKRAEVVDNLMARVPGATVGRDALIAGDEAAMDELYGMLVGMW